MGQRSSTETVVAVFQAFLKKRRWTQAQLSRQAEIGVPAVRKHLRELQKSGVPLESRRDLHDVWWSVPEDWYPGAVLFDKDSIPELLRQLCRLPRSEARNQLINRILKAAPRPVVAAVEPSAVLTPTSSEREETYLPHAEDAMNRKVALKINYYTSSRGDLAWRHVSIQRVKPDTPARFVAVCHRNDGLKWFRLDGVLNAYPDPSVPYRAADPAIVEALVSQSVDGFHQGDAKPCSFFVRTPECRWVGRNLPCAMTASDTRGGMRFSTTTAGTLRLARFVVGLGEAARADTPELASYVTALARGALESSSRVSASEAPPASLSAEG